MNEPAAATIWLYNVLKAHSPLLALVSTRIYPDIAPGKSTYPLIVSTLRSSRNTSPLGQNRLLRAQTIVTFNVLAVTDEGDKTSAADEIAHYIDAALSDAEESVTLHGQTYSISIGEKEEDIRTYTVEDGRRYNRVGAAYQVVVSPQ